MRKIIAFIVVLTMFSCENMNVKENKTVGLSENGKRDARTSSPQNKAQTPQNFKDALAFVQFCIEKIQSEKSDVLKEYTKDGVLVSPNAYIDTATARTIELEELSLATKNIYYWGIYSGRGDSILLSTADYLDQFIFNFDLDNAEINTYQGNPKARGSEQINIQDLFPSATTVAFYEPPSKEGYMDWNALYFVVQKTEDHFVLKAIVHNQWTP